MVYSSAHMYCSPSRDVHRRLEPLPVVRVCHASDVANQLNSGHGHLEDLRNALLSAFPTWSDLSAMFHVVFEEPLQYWVADGRPMYAAVSDLITWAQSKRKLDELVQGALGQNPSNLQLRAVADALCSAPTEDPRADGAVALGELTGGSDLDRCVYVAAIVYDLAAAKERIREHVERASRQPAVVHMPGMAALRLRSRGYDASSLEGAMRESFAELIGQANDLRVFAAVAPAAARTTWQQQRRRFLTGLLGERFKKREHGITRVLTLRERLLDTTAAVGESWATRGDGNASPPTVAETPAADALCGLCDALASVVHHACVGTAPIRPEIRGKILHIYDHVTKRNYSPVEAFP